VIPSCTILTKVQYDLQPLFYPESLVIPGYNIEKVEGSTMRWTNDYKFQSAEAASSIEANDYFSEMEEGFTNSQNALASRGEPSAFNYFTLERDGRSNEAY
jgi:hypothetical protein